MTDFDPADAGLLERSITYLLGCLRLVGDDTLARPTPCARWDLRALLWHVHDSLLALHEAVDVGEVSLRAADGSGVPGDPGSPGGPGSSAGSLAGPGGAAARSVGGDPVGGDPVVAVRDAARTLLGAWAGSEPGTISVAGCPVTTGLVVGTGAVEVAVHGWDVAMACGSDRPIPAGLAERLLALTPLLLVEDDRPGRFAPRIPAPRAASPSDQLVSFLGRSPAVR